MSHPARPGLRLALALLALVAGCASTGLAPDGRLRTAINLGNPALAKRSAGGEVSGVTIDLGGMLAQRLGAQFVPVLYPNAGALVEGAKSGAWDIAFAAIDRGLKPFKPTKDEMDTVATRKKRKTNNGHGQS